jgi:hypothetical protein
MVKIREQSECGAHSTGCRMQSRESYESIRDSIKYLISAIREIRSLINLCVLCLLAEALVKDDGKYSGDKNEQQIFSYRLRETQ